MNEVAPIRQNTRAQSMEKEINLVIHQCIYPDFRGALARSLGDIPNYCGSSDASAALYYGVSGQERIDYSRYFWFYWSKETNYSIPITRARAFLMAKGLWRDDFAMFF